MVGVDSKLYDIHTIVENEYGFNIPIYQRLYVWTEQQVKTLFEDLFTAYSTKKELYYIGGIIVVKNPNGNFDLVDGQQRFTTLWLLSNELKNILSSFTKKGEELRLHFSIRDNVTYYLKNIENKNGNIDSNETDFADLIKISKARKIIESLITEYLKTDKDQELFAKYIYDNLKMVITEVPYQTDLNKLFETLNNRGEQLQQHEILKARLLSHIKDITEWHQYATLWSVCSKMNEYVERTIAKEIDSSKEIAAQYNNGFKLTDVLNLFRAKEKKQKSINLIEILKTPESYKDESVSFKNNIDNHPETNEDEFEPVRSILTFPQLLLHTLRVFLYDIEQDDIDIINEKELLKTFDNYFLKSDFIDKESVKLFFKQLFEVKCAFDKYIIKWVETSKEKEEHLLKFIDKRNQKKGGWTYYLRRLKKESFHGFELLQSILYHSQQNTTQYWLTPFLYWVKNENPNFNKAYKWLRILDNTLLSSETKGLPLIKRTWNSIPNYLENKPSVSIFQINYNVSALGTKFPHYWFYKIEFVLWYYKNSLGKEVEWKDYKMTARNSIEHIGPQNPRDQNDKVCVEMLDTMGNLVLVTRSINSEYSDRAYGVKKSIFTDKKNKGNLDSLKSDIIYSEENWNDNKAKRHHQFILDLLEIYFKENHIQ
ncbi:DUF262 domain-containing protein [Polaribacter pectinis]|uniref:DUF262 domain-containing protein n=1 Tax=Polaribacter pectinis TaxID=2738844 RepID=A0A7G9L7I5_9FLAO|nr:DUF262 domain-containing protein [Polaribacter pectinis]QNM84584.1 DUF262 domain-containing protein [Polaribacter pectinis]